MKILLTIGSLGGGGAERVMVWLAESLAKSGHQVILVTQLPASADRYRVSDGIMRFSFGGFATYMNSSSFSGIVNAVLWARFLRQVRAETRPDVVLSFIDALNISVLAAFLFSSLPVVVSERTDPATAPISPRRKMVRPWLYRQRANAVVFQTQAIARKFSYEWDLSRVQVIPNPVTKAFAQAPKMTPKKVVMAVGRLDPLKGHDILIEAWAKLGSARDGWRLRIVGEGPLRADYAAMIARLGLGDSVELPGFTHDVIAELQIAGIGVLPSRVEGFPNALIEMMALGLPVVASDLPPACSEVIAQGQNGLLYDGRSSDALAASLRVLIDDPALRIQLGTAAEDVKTRYSEDACLALWIDCLQRAAG